MSRDDVLAIRAYLNTVTPVRNDVVANTLPFPFNIRTSMRVWNAFYFNQGDYKPTLRNRPNGIVARFSWTVPVTAAPATHPRRS